MVNPQGGEQTKSECAASLFIKDINWSLIPLQHKFPEAVLISFKDIKATL